MGFLSLVLLVWVVCDSLFIHLLLGRFVYFACLLAGRERIFSAKPRCLFSFFFSFCFRFRGSLLDSIFFILLFLCVFSLLFCPSLSPFLCFPLSFFFLLPSLSYHFSLLLFYLFISPTLSLPPFLIAFLYSLPSFSCSLLSSHSSLFPLPLALSLSPFLSFSPLLFFISFPRLIIFHFSISSYSFSLSLFFLPFPPSSVTLAVGRRALPNLIKGNIGTEVSSFLPRDHHRRRK